MYLVMQYLLEHETDAAGIHGCNNLIHKLRRKNCFKKISFDEKRFFVPDVFNSGTIGLYGNPSCSLWVCVSVCPSVMRESVRTMKFYVVAVIVAS